MKNVKVKPATVKSGKMPIKSTNIGRKQPRGTGSKQRGC